MNNFWQRTLTGILFVIVLAGGIFYHQLSFATIFLLIVVAGIHEMSILFSKTENKVDLFTTAFLGIYIFISTYLIQAKILDSSAYLAIIPIVAYIFIKELFLQNKAPLTNIALSLLTACYIALPFALINILAFQDGQYNFHLPLAIFILVWINDTGAYLSGITLGKHKFFERISPKKTWEGTIGGFVLTIVASYVLSLFWDDMNLFQWLIFGGITSIMAVLGDLAESMFKRSIGVKDSGTILPGHGGILDRFDAVLFAIPMAVFYIELLVR